MTKKDEIQTIPRPLVRTNQWVIVISVVITLLFGQYWSLLVPLLAGIVGLVFKVNPIMKIASLFLKKPVNKYIQEDSDQQQFNGIISVICLTIGFIGYLINFTLLAHVFTIIVGLAAFIAILGFCIGCFIRFQWQQYKYRRSSKPN